MSVLNQLMFQTHYKLLIKQEQKHNNLKMKLIIGLKHQKTKANIENT